MNTVDSLKKLYKTMAGKDWPYDPNPTDAEVIDKIAADGNAGGSGSGGPVIKLKTNMAANTTTADPLAAGLSLTDLSDATVEMHVVYGDSEALRGIYKPSGCVYAAPNIIQMTIVTPGPNGLTLVILGYNSDTGVVTILANDGSTGGPQ